MVKIQYIKTIQVNCVYYYGSLLENHCRDETFWQYTKHNGEFRHYENILKVMVTMVYGFLASLNYYLKDDKHEITESKRDNIFLCLNSV